MTESGEYTLNRIHSINVPEFIGDLIISDCIHISVTKFPNRFHRVLMRLLLGWKFERYLK